MSENSKEPRIFHMKGDDPSLSPKKLNEYIRIGSAGGNILIASLLIVALAVIIWGFVGRISVTITEYGVVSGSQSGTKYCICFIDVDKNTGVIQEGNEVNVHLPNGKSVSGKVLYMSHYPQSSEEIHDQFGQNDINTSGVFTDWVLDYLLENSKYSYPMTIETDEDITPYWHQVVDVTIIIGEVRPISLLIK